MANEKILLQKNAEELATVIDAKPGMAFKVNPQLTDTLSILEHRLPDSDLKQKIVVYNRIFSKTNQVTVDDICASSVALVYIRVLVKLDIDFINTDTVGAIITECNNQIVKMNNMLNILRLQLSGAAEYEVKGIQQKMDIYTAIRESYSHEIEILREKLNDLNNSPTSGDFNDDVLIPYATSSANYQTVNIFATENEKQSNTGDEISTDNKKSEVHSSSSEIPNPFGNQVNNEKSENEKAEPKSGKPEKTEKPRFTDIFSKFKQEIGSIHSKPVSEPISKPVKQTDDIQAPISEKSTFTYTSITKCKEVYCHDSSIVAMKHAVCKDIKAYSIMQTKNGYFIGFTDHIKGNKYLNTDNSLMQLMVCNDEFYKFITVDVTDDKEKFTTKEERALRAYFNFVTFLFESSLGRYSTIQELMDFKRYYNDVVQSQFILADSYREDYYRALVIADYYTKYMSYYDLSVAEDREAIAQNIIAGDVSNYLSDFKMLSSAHIVDVSSKTTIETLISQLGYFSKKRELELEVKKKRLEVKKEYKKINGLKQKAIHSEKEAKRDNLVAAIETYNKDKKEYENLMYERDNITPPDDFGIIGQTPDINTEPEIEVVDQPMIMPSVVAPINDNTPILAEDVVDSQIKLQFLDDNDCLISEKMFALNDTKVAVAEYLTADMYKKTFGICMNGKDVFLYASKEGQGIDMVLDDNTKHIKQLDNGIQGQMLELMQEKIKDTLFKEMCKI